MQANEERLRELMIAAIAGDARSHAQLLRALLPLLRRFFRRRLAGNEEEAEDLVQEVLIAVHTKRATYDPARPFAGWLYAIARYKLVDFFRRQRRHCPLENLEDILIVESFEDSVIAEQDIDSLLAGVSAKQAQAIRATWIEGLSTQEAAERQGIGQSDIKVSVHRGLKALAMRVKDSMK